MMDAQGWTRSSYCGNQCVLVRFVDGTAQVRDSKDPAGPTLVFNRGEWEAFELGVFNGEFSMPA
jgi:uncharacterized protein DUF397